MGEPRRRGVSKPRAKVSIEDAITDDALRGIISDRVILKKGALSMPSAASVSALVSQLNGWRLRILRNKEDIDEQRLLREAENTAKMFVDTLTRLRVIIEPRIDNGLLRPMHEKHLRMIDQAIDSSRYIARGMFMIQVSNSNKVNGWTWLASVLAADFEIMMRSTNPDFHAGISASGPTVRFVEAIIPLLTGEAPPRDSIVRAMKAARKKTSTIQG